MSKFEKLTITPEPGSNFGPIEVLFNPNTYSITKSVSWNAAAGQTQRGHNAPALQFSGGQSRTLSLELFFDTTEEANPAKQDVRNISLLSLA